MIHVKFPAHWVSVTVPVKVGALALLITASLSFGNPAYLHDDDDDFLLIPKVSDSGMAGTLFSRLQDIGNRAGFEIGNGKKLIKNLIGKYSAKIDPKYEVGQFEAFTEITSPLSEGVPRARWQINAVNSTEIQSLRDLYESLKETTWVPTALAKMQGLQREVILPNGVSQIDMRLFRGPGELVIMQMDGRPGTKALTPFDKVVSAASSFEVTP